MKMVPSSKILWWIQLSRRLWFIRLYICSGEGSVSWGVAKLQKKRPKTTDPALTQ